MGFDWGQYEKIESKVLVPPVNMISESEGLVLVPLENVKGALFSCIFCNVSDFPGKLEQEKQGSEKLLPFPSKKGTLQFVTRKAIEMMENQHEMIED